MFRKFLAGKVPMEVYGAYTISKHSVEAYSDVLRLEMQKWGVKVCIVQPSGYNTSKISESLYVFFMLFVDNSLSWLQYVCRCPPHAGDQTEKRGDLEFTVRRHQTNVWLGLF